MLWVLKRTVSMRRFFWETKTYVKTWKKNTTILMFHFFFYVALCLLYYQISYPISGSQQF